MNLATRVDSRFPRTFPSQTQGAQIVYGLFESKEDLNQARSSLRKCGFPDDSFSILVSKDWSKPKSATQAPEMQRMLKAGNNIGSRAQEGGLAGAMAGAFLGIFVGWLAGLGFFVLPGAGGQLLESSPILTTLAAVGLGGSLGGFTGALAGAGVPETDAQVYDAALKHRGILLSIYAIDRVIADLAKRVLVDSGAYNVTSASLSDDEIAGFERMHRTAGSAQIPDPREVTPAKHAS